MPLLYPATSLGVCPLPLRISSVGRFSDSIDMQLFQIGPSWASQAWPSNNRAIYAPVSIPARFTIARFFVVNGTNATGNVDVGIYDAGGNRLLSTGSTARSGTSVIQYIGVTDTSFPAGKYYLALVGSSTTGQYFRTMTNSAFIQISGWLLEDLGATTLPATMTPTASVNSGTFAFGFSQSDTL